MTGTPQLIYGLQLEILLAKTLQERLIQFFKDNDDMRMALKQAKEKVSLPDAVTYFPDR
jgi:hypothetical protein